MDGRVYYVFARVLCCYQGVLANWVFYVVARASQVAVVLDVVKVFKEVVAFLFLFFLYLTR